MVLPRILPLLESAMMPSNSSGTLKIASHDPGYKSSRNQHLVVKFRRMVPKLKARLGEQPRLRFPCLHLLQRQLAALVIDALRELYLRGD